MATQSEIQAEALQRATQGESVANYAAIYQGFMAKGIPESDILPRENVLTFHAWKARGRHVKKGEHGVKVVTFVDVKAKADESGAEQKPGYRRPWSTTVFHISQTAPLS